MANNLVFTEVTDDGVKGVTLEILAKLQDQDVEVCAVGEIPAEGRKQLAEFGAKKIHQLKGDNLDKYSPEGYANALKQFLSNQSYDHVFAGATSIGKDLMPRVSGMFEAGMAADVTNFIFEGDTFRGTRPFFAGKCLAKVEIDGPKPHFVTVRPNALGMPESAPGGGSEETQDENVEAGNLRAAIQEVIQGASDQVDLSEANIIVSGGRAMKNSENFKILDEFAEVIGATVGASRAAVDSGYAPHNMQVGQTGKTVSPSLYIACGISGAIQHLAGMRTSKVIVAINTDPDAPIFTKADYGIVGDLFEIVPMLKEEFQAALGK